MKGKNPHTLLLWAMIVACFVGGCRRPTSPSGGNSGVLWTRTYGGAHGDYAYSVERTSDGGIIMAGMTLSYGESHSDVYVIRTSAHGHAVWAKTYGGSSYEEGRSVQQTSDGGYIIAGTTGSFGAGKGDVWLIKVASNGDTLWTRTYGGQRLEQGNCAQETSDGGYIVVGYTYQGFQRDVYLVKADANGDTMWTRTYGGGGDDVGYSVQQSADGGYIVMGDTESFGSGLSDVWVLKIDANGNCLWTKTYGGEYTDCGRSVQQTLDGGYIIAGYSSSFGAGGFEIYLMKTDASGDAIWTKTYEEDNSEMGYSVRETADGGYVVGGYTYSTPDIKPDADVVLIKTNQSGDLLWRRVHGGSGDDYGYCVEQVLDGGYIIAGSTSSFGAEAWDFDVYLVRMRP